MGCAVHAQNIGGIWLSGSSIIGDGTGIHNGETQVLSLEDSVVNIIAASGGAGTGKLILGNLKFKKSLNANSVSLFSSASRGITLPNLVFKFYERKLNGFFIPSLTITLSNVIVVKYKISSPDSAAVPTSEEISLLYEKIQFSDNAGNSSMTNAGARF